MSAYAREQRRIFVKVCEAFMFRPYIWGGDDFSGIDCSGMVVEGLKAVGLIGQAEDLTADMLWRRFQSKYQVQVPKIGALAFWFDKSGRAYHVAVFVSDYFVLTANGGGSSTNSVDDAIRQNAFVTIRPVNHRSTPPLYLDLF